MTATSDGGGAAREAHEAIDRAMTEAHYTHTDASEADCWFDADRVAGDAATTAWKRLARWRQARWRDARGYPIGFDPYAGGPRATRVGSRLGLEFARETTANFITPQAQAAVRARLALREEHQTLAADSLVADLLDSLALSFNVFGTLYGSADTIRRALTAFWPDMPRGDVSMRFDHSPGRRDPAFLGDLTRFDVAFEIEAATGAAIVGVSVKYHEHPEPDAPLTPEVLARYVAVAERSDVFRSGFQRASCGTRLASIWREHLLLLSMLQHASQRWQHGKFVLAYPALHPSFGAAAAQYRAHLARPETFEAVTIESLLRTPGALDRTIRDAIQARYF